MTKTILILAIAAAFIAGSIATGTIVFADDEGGSLLCDADKVMTGIVFGDDDDITQIFCTELLEGPPGPVGTFGTYVRSSLVNVASGAIESLTFECRQPDDLVISGGFLDRPSPQNLKIIENRFIVTQTGIKWQVTGENLGTANAVLQGYALCATFP